MTSDEPDGISNEKIVYYSLLAAAIVLLIVFFGGMAMRGHDAVMGDRDFTRDEWLDWAGLQLLLSLGSAVVVGTLVAAWRLVNRKNAQWGVAAMVVALLLFGFLVWPTPWTYREFGCDIYQLNRLFGTRTKITKLPSCETSARAEVPASYDKRPDQQREPLK